MYVIVAWSICQQGVEDHGVEASFDDLVNATLSADWDVAVPPGSRDLRLNAGKPEIDAGTTIANLNDPFTINSAPDMGAFEFGEPLPSYGIRPLIANFDSSTKTVNDTTPENGETVTFTITLQNTGADYDEVVSMVDNLPPELSYNAGTLSATLGTVDDAIPTSLKWSGTPDSEQTIVITYEATVNTATIKSNHQYGRIRHGLIGHHLPTNNVNHQCQICILDHDPKIRSFS